MNLFRRIALAALVFLAAAPAFGSPDARLSLTTQPYMSADASSSDLYYVSLDGSTSVSVSLAGVDGKTDVYSTITGLCLTPWVNDAPAQTSCLGVFVGVVNPVNGVARCDFSRGLNRRCDVWNYYNREELVLDVGDPSNTPAPPSCCVVNGWYRVPGDRAVRPFWQNAGYNALILQGRPVARVTAKIAAQVQLYTHNSYSPGTGLLFYQLGLSYVGQPSGSPDYCGFLSTRAEHMDSSVVTDRMVSNDGAPSPGDCVMPMFQGTKTLSAWESAGDNGMVLSSAARWSFMMQVRQTY